MKKIILCVSFIAFSCLNAVLPSEVRLGQIVNAGASVFQKLPLPKFLQLPSGFLFKLKIGCVAASTVLGFSSGYASGYKWSQRLERLHSMDPKTVGLCVGVPCGMLSFATSFRFCFQGR